MAGKHLKLIATVASVVRASTRPGAPSLASRVQAVPRLVRATLSGRYVGTTRGRLGLLAAAAAYIVSPVDLVPEAILPVLGTVDDAVVISWRSRRWWRRRTGSWRGRPARVWAAPLERFEEVPVTRLTGLTRLVREPAMGAAARARITARPARRERDSAAASRPGRLPRATCSRRSANDWSGTRCGHASRVLRVVHVPARVDRRPQRTGDRCRGEPWMASVGACRRS